MPELSLALQDAPQVLEAGEAHAGEDLYRLAFEDAPVGKGLLLSTGRWQSVNRALCGLLGYAPGEADGVGLEAMVGTPDFRMLLRENERLLSGEALWYQSEKNLSHRQGHAVPVQLSVSLLRRGGVGQDACFLVEVQDLTERRESERELSRARDMAVQSASAKGRFMASMSHELRTPISGMVGMLELLEGGELSQEQRESVRLLREGAEAMAVVANDVLDYSRIEAGKMPLEYVAFDVRSLADSAVAFLRPRAQEKGLSLSAVVYRDVPSQVLGDPTRVRQVLLNLLANAVKFTHSGRVTLRVMVQERDASHVLLCFSVADSGIGIGEEAQERLFRPFEQAQSSTARHYGGTGLGLAISRQLVELMGGEIGVRSKLGKGSAFWFTARFRKQSEEASPTHTRVLAVSASAEQRQAILQHFAQSHLRADAYPDAASSLDALHRELRLADPYSLALLDARLPGPEGWIRQVRAHPPLSPLRIVVLTDPGDDQARFIEAGASACAHKYLYAPSERPPEPSSNPDACDTAPSAATPRLRILVAEDSSLSRKVVLSQLAQLGHEAEAAEDGRQALEMWEKGGFELILMDCQMPEVDGYAATRAIRCLENERAQPASAPRRIPIIALTASALEGARDECLASGMDDYLAKPVRQASLAAVLARWASAGANDESHLASSTCSTPNAADPQGVYYFTHGEFGSELILDTRLLRELLCVVGEVRVRELVSIFEQSVPASFAALREAVEAGDAGRAGRAAHKLAGSCMTVGVARLAALCCAVEAAASRGDLGEARALLGGADGEFGHACVSLRGFVRECVVRGGES